MDETKKANPFLNAVLKILSAILILIIAGVLACFGTKLALQYFAKETKETIKETVSITSEDSEAEEKKFENPSQKEDSVIVGKVEWKLLEAKDLKDKVPSYRGDDDYCKASPDMKFVSVRYSVKNVDRAFVTVPKRYLKVYDKEKVEYKESDKTNRCLLNDESVLDKYKPTILELGQKYESEALFEIPKNAKDLKLKVGDLSTVGDLYQYIELDL